MAVKESKVYCCGGWASSMPNRSLGGGYRRCSRVETGADVWDAAVDGHLVADGGELTFLKKGSSKEKLVEAESVLHLERDVLRGKL